MAVLALLVLVAPTFAQEPVTLADYERAEGFLSNYTRPLVFNTSVSPNWLDDGRMWYRSTVADGSEFVLVDPSTGTRARAFDHDRLAEALSSD
ncbi:MAG: S9 family peptidase, partial [Bacteroidetes bacterium]|nr:S9 family peptidase [Bacteroidota bacterium]